MYCNNIPALLNETGIVQYSPENWRLFIDSYKQSYKCVLLRNGNKYGSIPIAHSVEAKETYASIKLVLELTSYHEHQWIIVVDLNGLLSSWLTEWLYQTPMLSMSLG